MRTPDLMPTISAERQAFGDVLEGLPESDWNAPSLCSGWRPREVIAHLTMPFRYSAPRFLGEMVRAADVLAYFDRPRHQQRPHRGDL